MAGRSASNAVTRYAGIQVQTSALGLNIPVGWGTFRCKCNLVDYLDFKSVAQKAAGGKGGSTTTGYSYSATIILALCEGPIDAVTTVYVDSKTYVHGSAGGAANTGSAAAMTQAGLTLNTGAIGQPVWSYLTSNHPTHAIGYSGLTIAYAGHYALDSGASTPNHSFEVVRTASFGVSGSPDADPSLVVADFFNNGRTGVPSWGACLLGSLTQYQDYCLATGLLVSPVIDAQRSASDFLTELLMATNSTCVWSEGLLKFIPYGDTALTGNGKTYTPNNTPVYSLNDDDFVVKTAGDPPVTVDIQDQTDAYNVVQFEYLDRANQYNMAIALANDAANVAQYGMRRKDPDTVHCICTAAVAQQSAQLYLQRTLYIRAQYKFTLHYAFMLLEPGDILELTDGGLGLSAYPVRIIQVDEDEQGQYEITAEDFPIGVSLAPLYAMQTGQGTTINQAVDPGGVEANLLLWSEDFTNAVWATNGLNVTPKAAADPLFGATTADKLIPTTANQQHYCSQPIAVFEGSPYNFSLYVRAAGYTQIEIQISDFVSSLVYANFDLSAGVMTAGPVSAGGGADLLALDANISPIGGGWYRIFLTAIPTTVATLYAVALPYAAGGSTVFPGDGTSGVYAWGAQFKQGVDVPAYCKTSAAIAGPFLFNPPVSLAHGPQSEAAAAVAGGANWGGCNVWTSIDGTNYQLQGVINGPARYGYLMSALAAGADPDTTDTLAVDLGVSAGVLTGGSSADADASATLSLINGELIAYSAATLTAQNRYSLGIYTRRGQMGTVSAAHAAGSIFIRLDEGVFYFPYIATQAGQQVYVKFQSFNHWGLAEQSLANVNAYLITLDPVGTSSNVIGGGNRICFSDFDHGASDGWSSNTSGPAVTTTVSAVGGVLNRFVSATATAGGQAIDSASIQFPVTGGERLAVQAGFGVSSNAAGSLIVSFYDDTGALISNLTAATQPPCGANYPAKGFVYAPANAVSASLEAYVSSVAAGVFSTAVSRPMVCGASTEQTTFPAYVKGPAAEYGSDITGNWTAAAIAGQGALATLNQATWATQVTGIGKPADYANVSIVWRQSTAPTSPTVNDIWVKTDGSGNPLAFYAWNGSTWLLGADITSINVAAGITGQGALATLSEATWATQVTGIGKPADYANVAIVWRQATAPTSPTVNDIWVQLDGSGNQLAIYAWNGSTWILGADITGLNTAAGFTGQAPAATDPTIQPGATNNPVYAQTTDPYGGGYVPPGAFWFDEANGIPYIGVGGGWQVFTPSIASGTVVKSQAGPSSGSAVSGAYTIPANFGNPYAIVSLRGASGGASWAGSNANVGAGGGTAVSKIAVSPGDVINFILGAKGGNGTSGSHNGQNASGSTASESTSGMSLTANGGGGAPDTPVDATGTPGTASGGNVSNTTGSATSGGGLTSLITITAST